MPNLLIFGADLVAIATLTFGAYYRRHRRRDMLLPFIALNIGVLAVCAVLSGVAVGIGVGLGLFGVLAIIRLRSTELSQEEVAYYFASLALGLIAGLQPNPQWLAPLLSLAIVAIFLVLDQPKFHQKHRRQEIILDAVYASEADLIGRLELLLDADVSRAIILRTDLVRDLTVVDARYTLRNPGSSSSFRNTRHKVTALEDSPAYAATVAR